MRGREILGGSCTTSRQRKSGGMGPRSWPEVTCYDLCTWFPELGRLSPVLAESPSSSYVLCTPSPPSYQEVGTRRGLTAGTVGIRVFSLRVCVGCVCLCSMPSTSRPFSSLQETWVSPAPDHRKLPLSHLRRVVELTAIHIFGRELAVRPKLGVC